jgi:hypothetical protein
MKPRKRGFTLPRYAQSAWPFWLTALARRVTSAYSAAPRQVAHKLRHLSLK